MFDVLSWGGFMTELFYFEIEKCFCSPKRGVAVGGKIQKGKIWDTARVSVIDEKNHVLLTTHILDIDWFGRYRTKHAVAEEGQIILILFPYAQKEIIEAAKAVVIRKEKP